MNRPSSAAAEDSKEIDERDTGAQHERRRSGGEEKAAPVHTGDTSGERVRVRLGEELVDRVLQRPEVADERP